MNTLLTIQNFCKKYDSENKDLTKKNRKNRKIKRKWNSYDTLNFKRGIGV